MLKENAPLIIDMDTRKLQQNNLPSNTEKQQTSGTGMENTLLSIMIVTRNRRKELLRALQSCVECSLPPGTEFVIVDNASQDGTREAVDAFFQNNGYKYRYFYQSENIYAAAGRNVGLREAKGRYVFFLDDDAYIQSPKEIFFQKMIDVLTENEDVFSITTSMFDTKLNSERPCIPTKSHCSTEFHKVLVFHGGANLVDKQRLFDRDKLFLEHQFRGMAELYPSLKSYFNGKYVFEMDHVQTIHAPSENSFFSEKMQTIYHYTGSVHVKLTFYPLIAYPILYAMFCLRIFKHLGFQGLPEAFVKLSLINKNLVRETVTIRKFLNLFKEFGFVATF